MRISKHFDSAVEFSEYAGGFTAQTFAEKGVVENIETSGQYWLGAKNLDTVYRYQREGWPVGVEKTMAALRDLGTVPPPESIRRRLRRREFGDEYDIHMRNRGQHNRAWTVRQRSSGAGPQTITIECPIACTSTISADQAFWRGAAALYLADMFSEAGYNVRIIARATSDKCSEDGDVSVDHTIDVKPANVPVELNSLAAMLALVGTFRATGFLARARHLQDEGNSISQGVGWTDPNPPAIDWGGRVIRIPVDCFSQESARKFIRSELAEDGQLAA